MNKSSWKYKRQGNVEALGENYVTVRHESMGLKQELLVMCESPDTHRCMCVLYVCVGHITL
jgi:hypothetical protein